MKPDLILKKNRLAIIMIFVALIAAVVLFCLPIYEFDSSVFTKKSSNTFVGDEKYQEALGEVNAAADELRAAGREVEINEEVTLRTNSKGEQTSLVAFSVDETFNKTGWDFLGAGLSSSVVLLIIAVCLVLSAICAVLGAIGSMDVPQKKLNIDKKVLRSMACWLALIAFLLVAVFVMMNTYTFSRRVTLYSGGIETEGKEEFYDELNTFLFNGAAADDIESSLKNMKFNATLAVWLIMPCAFLMILGAIQLRYGRIGHALMRGVLYAFVIGLCLFILYPYYVMLITAFRTNAETNDMYFQHMLPTTWEFSNLSHIMNRGVPQYLLNSGLIAGGATLIALVCGIPAAYAMSRMQFKGKKIFLGFVIMSQMFSPVVLLIGISQLMSTLKLNNSIVGLMLINAAFNQAFAIWLLRGTFVSISPEMEQAARIDGCSTMGSLWHVLIPMAAPGIVTTLIFVFINSWNEYTISTVLISTAARRPITVGITQFSSFNMIEWQYLFASSLIATIPVVIMFMFIEKHLTSGLTAGGVKG